MSEDINLFVQHFKLQDHAWNAVWSYSAHLLQQLQPDSLSGHAADVGSSKLMLLLFVVRCGHIDSLHHGQVAIEWL